MSLPTHHIRCRPSTSPHAPPPCADRLLHLIDRRVVLKTEEGSVSYKPMFLSLSQLEQTWALARGILSRTLAAKRGHERRMAVSKVVKAAAAVAGIPPSPPSQERGDDEAEEPADAGDDLDPAADLGDPPEIKEFLEELGEGRGAGGAHHGGQGAGGPVSPLVLLNRIAGSIACSATALVGQCVCSAGDAADQILFDRAWGWRVLGMDPRANVEATTLTEVLTRVGEREAGVRRRTRGRSAFRERREGTRTRAPIALPRD